MRSRNSAARVWPTRRSAARAAAAATDMAGAAHSASFYLARSPRAKPVAELGRGHMGETRGFPHAYRTVTRLNSYDRPLYRSTAITRHDPAVGKTIRATKTPAVGVRLVAM